MVLPLTRVRTFQTPLTRTQVFEFAEERKNRTIKLLWLFTRHPYSVKVDGDQFSLRLKATGGRNSPSHPKIKCEFINDRPTTLRISIIPNYFKLAFFLVFALVFVSFALATGNMTINSEYREPKLLERISFALFGAGIPAVIGFIQIYLPINKADDWIREKLQLTEVFLNP